MGIHERLKMSDMISENPLPRMSSPYPTIDTDKKKLQYYFRLPKKYMYALAKFGCANSKIPTIVGRYTNKPLEDRTCTMCDSDEIGDEFHYLFKCSKVKDLRTKHIKKYYYRFPSVIRMYDLFNKENKKQILDLAKFICEVLQVFK